MPGHIYHESLAGPQPRPEVAQRATGLWRWFEVAAVGFAMAYAIAFGAAVWVNFVDPRGIDFISFWAAARLTAEGQASLAYDIAAHHRMQLAAAPTFDGLMPFPYPPPLLLLLWPFGLPPYWLGFALWVGVTGAFYVLASRFVARAVVALAHPAVFLNAFIGQTGFLTCGLFMLGASYLSTMPLVGGAIWGLLVIKPQLAPLLPVALIAGRQWKAIAGGAMSAALLLVAAFALLGWDAYAGFFRILPFYTDAMAKSEWPWSELASPFAFLRYLDVPEGAALLVHAAIALAGAVVTWRAWAAGSPVRVPVLAAATMLISPYTLTYDALLLVVPLGWLIAERRRPGMTVVISLLCFLPMAGFDGPYPGPNTVPIASVLCLWALLAQRSRPLPHQATPLPAE